MDITERKIRSLKTIIELCKVLRIFEMAYNANELCTISFNRTEVKVSSDALALLCDATNDAIKYEEQHEETLDQIKND